jgi:hypothetical protein
MSITKADLLELAIRDLARDYFKETRPKFAPAAPILNPVAGVNGLSYAYQVVDGSGAEVIGAVTTLSNEAGNLTPASIALDSVTFTLDQIDLGVFQISDSTADAFTAQAGGGSATDEFVASLMSRAYVRHSQTARAACFAQLDAEVLDVNDESFKEDMDDLILKKLLETGVRPNTIVLDPKSVKALSKRNFVRDFGAIALTATAQVRTGWANEDSVRAYLAGAHGLDLVVDDSGYRTSSVAPRQFIWEGAGVLCHVGGKFATMNTMVQYSGEIAKLEVRRNAGIQRIGFSVAAEGIWLVHARNPETGCIFSTTGSSLSA